MKKLLLIVLLFSSLATCAMALGKEKTDEVELKYNELKVLKLFLDNSRDSLDSEMKTRWEAKERYIQQKKLDKEEMTDLRQKLEKNYQNLSRVKEETLLYEGKIEDENASLEKMTKEVSFLSSAVKDNLEGIIKKCVQHFPLSVEAEKMAVNNIQRGYLAKKNNYETLREITAFYKARYSKYSTIAQTKKTVLSDDNTQSDMNIIRIGEVSAYGISATGDVYIIRQTGNLGSSRFAIDNIASPDFKNQIQVAMKQWIKSGHVNGMLPFEVLQNGNSKKLISGEEISKYQKLYDWFKKGGAVMWAMAIIVVWTIFLIIIKLLQFNRKHKDATKLRKEIVKILETSTKEDAVVYIDGKKGIVAKAVKACLHHSQWSRSSAEKAVREILVEEVPQLNKSLTTLAVLASSAPMLGLLGTVTGMIHLFKVITQYGTSDPSILAGGISEALITTQAGLIVAIPLLLTHNFLKNKARYIQTEIERNTIKVLNRLWPEG